MKRFLKESEAAEFIGMSRQFLRKSRMNGTLRAHTPGPPYVKLGRSVRYDLSDLERWLEAHKHYPSPCSLGDWD